MSINPSEGTRYDTRGLPEGYDPHMFYEYRRDTNAQTADGIESFVYKYIPWNLVKSFAFAIDPTAPFKVAPHSITPFNRTRKRSVASVLQKRYTKRHIYNWGYSQIPNWNGVSNCWSPSLASYTEYNPTLNEVEITNQPPLTDSIDDTTSRTRLIGSEQGTMRYFKSYINSPPRFVYTEHEYRYIYHTGAVDSTCTARGGAANNTANSKDTSRHEVYPTSAVLFPNAFNTFRDSEYAYLEGILPKEGTALLKEWSPNKRDYTLFRNLVELRDVERSIVSLQDSVIKFRQLYVSLAKSPSLRDIIFNIRRAADTVPSEYLSYHFGWKQLYKDMWDLLNLPAKMSKKYEFLIRRAGKPTTFRTKKTLVSASTGSVPDFDYDNLVGEYGKTLQSRVERNVELRLVINATFDFPPPNGVSFRSHHFLDRIGLVPRPTDIYNLIPWTWLIDYFTGLGNYVELIDNMNRDDSLINWGMITAHTSGALITEFKSKTDNGYTLTEDFIGATTTTNTVENRHTSSLNYECQIRKDVATIYSVNTTCKPNLSAYQQSIIGAILAQRKDKLSPSAFRPRT